MNCTDSRKAVCNLISPRDGNLISHISLWRQQNGNLSACVQDHFQNHDHCPGCNNFKPQSHQDFCELVVSDPQSQEVAKKTAIQPFWSKRSSQAAALSMADLCAGAMGAMEVQKQHVRILLKQFMKQVQLLTKGAVSHKRETTLMAQQIESMKRENLSLKQRYDQVVGDLEKKLKAREATNADLQRQMQRSTEKYRRSRSPSASLSGSQQPIYQKPRDSATSMTSPAHFFSSGGHQSRSAPPPGFLERSRSNPVVSRSAPMQMAPSRPHSGASYGSNTSAPSGRSRSRDDHGFHSYQPQRVNKRRRTVPASPSSVHQRMSPSAAFLATRGPSSEPRGPFFRRG